MYTIVYISACSPGIGDHEIQAIVDTSRPKNERVGITGLLVHCKGNFLQVLEGDEKVVNELFAKISGDDRHLDLRHVDGRTIDQRHFPQWSMGYENVASIKLVDNLLQPLLAAGIITHDVISAALLERFAANS